MASLSGIVKRINDLVTGTPADDDCFVFGKTDLKKITLAKLKDALGITSLNSALTVRLSDEEYRTNESMYDNPIYARSFVVTLIDALEGDIIEVDLTDLPDCTYAWLDLSNSYIYSSYASYPLTYADNLGNSVSAHIDFKSKKATIQVKGNWSTYTAWLVVKYY